MLVKKVIKPYRFAVILFLLLCLVSGRARVLGQDKKDSVSKVKVDSMPPVTVRPVAMPPKIKGDTMEYNTANIRVQPNAAVEEMLRRLPGLQIDINGNITFNGEKIQRLLVDGEDIFGANPTLITRNFDADKIEKVQLIDQKSERSRFTGVDDGSRAKVLNLVLKASARNSYFGKTEAGADHKGIYSANGLVAGFKGKEQFMVLGMASNTGVTGFTGDASSGAMLSVAVSSVNNMGASAGIGIPRYIAGGLHYVNSWNVPDCHLVGNYQYANTYTRPETSTHSIQTISDSLYIQDQQSRSVNRSDQHWGYGTYDFSPSGMMSFRTAFYGVSSTGDNSLEATGSSRFNNNQVNNSDRHIESSGSIWIYGGSLDWKLRSKKPGHRSLSITSAGNQQSTNTDGFLYSLNRFYRPNGSLQSSDTIDQRKKISDQLTNLSGSFNYTEKISPKVSAAFSYGLSYAGNNPLQAAYDRGNGKYQDYIDSLSTNFKEHTFTHRVTFNLQGQFRKLGYTLGSDWNRYSYTQHNLLLDTTHRYIYNYIAPRIILDYVIKPTTVVNFSYSAGGQPPPMNQMSPVKNNNDPLHILIGNPALKPGFRQNFTLGFRRLKTLMIRANLTVGIISNAITTKTYTDTLGRQISQAVNVDGGQSATLNFSLNKTLKDLGIDAGFAGNASYNRSLNYINTDLSRNDNYNAGAGFTLSKYVPDQFSMQLKTNLSWFSSRSSVNTANPIQYWAQNHSGSLSLYYLPHCELVTSAEYTWQGKSSSFSSNISTLFWNAYVLRHFMNNRLAIKFQVNNILNQNSGISRTNSNNVNTQSFTNVLGRYWMFSAIYRFNKVRKAKD